MITLDEALAILEQNLPEAKKAWARRMLTDIVGNALERDAFVHYALNAEAVSKVREQLAEDGELLQLEDGTYKPHPLSKVYEAGVKRLERLLKLLKLCGVTPFEGA